MDKNRLVPRIPLLLLAFVAAGNAVIAGSPSPSPAAPGRHPLRNHEGLFLLDVEVSGLAEEAVKATVLLDTACPSIGLNRQLLGKVGAEIESDPTDDSDATISPTMVTVGGKLFTFSKCAIIDEPTIVTNVTVTATFGATVLWEQPVVVDLREGSLWFPGEPIEKVAASLGLAPVSVQYDHGFIWIEAQANGENLKDYAMDCASLHSTLLPADLERAHVPVLDAGAMTKLGLTAGSNVAGPVTLGWKGFSRPVAWVERAPVPTRRIIGLDALAGHVLAIDAPGGRLWLGK